MTRKRYTEEQIIAVMKEAQAGIPATELCRKHGISSPTFYKWKSKYAGMEPSDLRKMRILEEENRKLKHLVADLTLDNQALKAINAKNW
jgi:putative transposase